MEMRGLGFVSFSCLGKTVGLTFLTKRRLVFDGLPMNAIELKYKHTTDVCVCDAIVTSRRIGAAAK